MKYILKMSLIFVLGIFWTISYSSDLKKLYVISKNGIVLREGPSVESKRIDIIEFGTIVKVVQKEKSELINGFTSNWYKVKINKSEGYCWGGYLSEYEPILDDESLIGEYLQKIPEKDKYTAIPSKMFLNKNNDGKYIVNLCEKFGAIYGKWYFVKLDKSTKGLIFQFCNSNFGLIDSEKFLVIYKVDSNNELELLTGVLVGGGCDFIEGQQFRKK